MSKKEELAGFVDRGVKINGELEFHGTFRIDGNFSGKIRSDDTLVIGEHGEVEGEIDVGVVSVSGNVGGKIIARERLEIQNSGKVFADISTPTFMVAEGGVFHGNCDMNSKEGVDSQIVKWKTAGERG